MSPRFASLLADRVDPSSSRFLCKKFIEGKATDDIMVLEFVQREALDTPNFGTNSWAPQLEQLRSCYDLGVVFEPSKFHAPRNRKGPSSIPLPIAQEILRTPDHLPSFLIALAEERCRQEVSRKIVPVIMISERDGWFSALS
jgi:hypothetical protein